MTIFTGGWVDCPDFGASMWTGGELLYDAGPYTGPWPPTAPDPALLPADGGEIDYFVGLPNPSGILNALFDGSYPTDFYSAQTWKFTADPAVSAVFLTGEDGAPFVVGMHLYIGWWSVLDARSCSDWPQPSVSAASLVPDGWITPIPPPPPPDLPETFGGDFPAVHLYDPTGVSWLADLTHARAITWQHELSKPGTASFEVPLADAGLITDLCIVKFSWHGAIRFGARIRTSEIQLAVDGTRWVKYADQPGLLTLLDDAVVYPEYGLNRASPGVRNFGYMSQDGPWRNHAEWQAPQATTWGDSPGPHHNYPLIFGQVDPTVAWIAFNDPSVSAPGSAINYYRGTFHFTLPHDLTLFATGDNFLDLYLDGQQIIAADRLNAAAFMNATQLNIQLGPGNHLFAAKVENSPRVSPGYNPVALMLTLLQTGDDGNPVPGDAVIRTDTTHWLVNDGDPEPGWPRAWVLQQLITEAQTRGVLGPGLLALDFDHATDSDGEAWTDRGSYAVDVGTITLGDLATQLSEAEIDVDVDADTMTFRCFNRKGADLSATVTLALGDAEGTLTDYGITRTATRFTRVLTQLYDGVWVATSDSAGIAEVGLIETALNLGSTSSAITATGVAQAQLAESASPLVSATGAPTTLAGPLPYVDYGLGDSITVPGYTGDPVKARILSITVDGSGEIVRAWPEFVQDPS